MRIYDWFLIDGAFDNDGLKLGVLYEPPLEFQGWKTMRLPPGYNPPEYQVVRSLFTDVCAVRCVKRSVRVVVMPTSFVKEKMILR